MSRKISLRRYAPSPWNAQDAQGYSTKIETFDAEEMSDAIFVYRVEGGRASFTNVASPAELEDYPEGSGEDISEYRLNSIILVFRNLDEAVAIWDDIVDEAKRLVKALNMLDSLVPEEEITID